MKKLIGIIAIVLIGCSAPDPVEVEANDCKCDKVIQVDVPYQYPDGTPDGYRFGKYKTKNECTGTIKTGDYVGSPPKLGDCK